MNLHDPTDVTRPNSDSDTGSDTDSGSDSDSDTCSDSGSGSDSDSGNLAYFRFNFDTRKSSHEYVYACTCIHEHTYRRLHLRDMHVCIYSFLSSQIYYVTYSTIHVS
jgi:hypothetical protein